MKQGSLFLFCHVKISQTMALHAKKLLVSLESSQWVRVHWLGLQSVSSYDVEAIDYWIIFSMKTKLNWNWNLYWSWGVLCVVGKPSGKSNLIKFISQFSELRHERYGFLSEICCWKFKPIPKIQLCRQCVHIVEFRNFEFSKCEK
jgi:hypothetical protein